MFKGIVGFMFCVLLVSTVNTWAEDVTTVKAKDADISENLDLEAIASVFGEVKDLEEFEKKLNDPDARLSNLDLNGDGEVDYLRVVDTSKGDTHVVTIQAVIGKDQYQDVATIDVEKDKSGETQVQVVGNVYMYGPGYIVEPVYVHPPIIFGFFWSPFYRPWHSPFYWGFYPPYFHPWPPYPPYRYRRDVRVHIDINNSYRYTSIRKSKTAIELEKKTRRNDFEKKHPDKSFNKRNSEAKKRSDLIDQKPATEPIKSGKDQDGQTTGVAVKKDWKPTSERADQAKQQAKESKSSPAAKKDVKVPTQLPKLGKQKLKRPEKRPMGRPEVNVRR